MCTCTGVGAKLNINLCVPVLLFMLIIQPDVSTDEQEDSGMEDSRGISGWDKVHNLAKALVSLEGH